MAIAKRDAKSDTVDAPYTLDPSRRNVRVGSLPLVKPPYGTLTAIDLNTGDTRWTIPLGDSPDVRNNPALAGVALPERLGVVGSPGGMVTGGGLVFLTGGGRVLYAIDARTGEYRWEHDLGQVGYSNPMTFRSRAGKQYIVIATGGGTTSRLMAFAIP